MISGGRSKAGRSRNSSVKMSLVLALEAFRVGYPEMGMTYPSLKETFGMPKVVRGNAGEACEECQEVQVGNVNLCYHSPFTNHVGRIVNCPVCYAQGIDMVHVIVDCRGLDELLIVILPQWRRLAEY